MSITYEEALATLTSMFGPPWTQELLDAVLRHHQGHMENTVESVLAHGDGDPQALVDSLKASDKASETAAALDEQLAKQLADEEKQQASGRRPRDAPQTGAAPSPKPTEKGRGTPTELPPDFLRVPGGAAVVSSVDSDERLARMLQDELFAQELVNNPEFAHLARGGRRGRPRTVGGQPTSSRVGELPTSRTVGPPGRTGGVGDDGPHIMEKISEMGETAKKRLALLAAQWNMNNRRNANDAAGGAGGSSGAVHEQRGLLDGDDDDGIGGGAQQMEMSSSPMGLGSKKQM